MDRTGIKMAVIWMRIATNSDSWTRKTSSGLLGTGDSWTTRRSLDPEHAWSLVISIAPRVFCQLLSKFYTALYLLKLTSWNMIRIRTSSACSATWKYGKESSKWYKKQSSESHWLPKFSLTPSTNSLRHSSTFTLCSRSCLRRWTRLQDWRISTKSSSTGLWPRLSVLPFTVATKSKLD